MDDIGCTKLQNINKSIFKIDIKAVNNVHINLWMYEFTELFPASVVRFTKYKCIGTFINIYIYILVECHS